MKKIIFILVATLVTISVGAQTLKTVEKKIEKSNADIANEKKAALSNTWHQRAIAYQELSEVYTNKLVQGFQIQLLGKPDSFDPAVVGGEEYLKCEFPDYSVYVSEDGLIQFWTAKKGDELGSLDESVKSLEKMKQISDNDFNSKGGAGLSIKISNQLSQSGRVIYSLGDSRKAATYFNRASKAAELAGIVDTISVYFEGVALADNQEWDKAIAVMDRSLSYGNDFAGLVQIYLATCYTETGKPEKAVAVLEDAFAKHPKNSNVMSALINVYLEQNIDPQKLITLVKNAQALDQDNASLHMVEGVVWGKLNDWDKAEAAFNKTVELENDNFNTFFNIGLTYAQKGDEITEQANALDINDNQGYKKLHKEALVMYAKSITALEKAHGIDKKEPVTIELLRALYFKKYDDGAEFVTRYNYFDKLYTDIVAQ